MNIDKELKKIVKGKVLKNERLELYNTYRIKGIIDYVVSVESINELVELLSFLKQNNIKHKVIGNGSNIIFANSSYHGVLIKLTEIKNIKITDTKIVVGAGYNLVKLAMETSRLGLSGLEFATGIPGTIGGAVYMNAGAYKTDMGYIVSEIKVLTPSLEIETLYNCDLDFHYRTSFLQKNPGYICLEATIVLKKGNKDIIKDLIEERKKRRIMTQPLEYPSAGSVFRNPDNDYAGRLIEEIDYKGKNIGGAYVSEKHANFIINKDNATGKDIISLIEDIKSKVKNKYNVELKVEQEIVE
ncbi:MAG: UDP-N-acetylmuramate dehydrogenase [Bacilli bacterium]|nr:UDP-N-acetylmuramate dehydrogenase [Bacilli bacterium]